MKTKVRNFYAGPGKLPDSVLERIKNEMTNFDVTSMSVMEISHRAQPILDLIGRVQKKFKSILKLDDEDEVLFLQGGGTLQFTMIPLNFSGYDDTVTYVDTGYWAKKAIEAVKELPRNVEIIKADDYTIPKSIKNSDISIGTIDDTKYLHICSNNTVVGTQWFEFPFIDNVPLIADMSSDLLSRNIDAKKFGLIYAHAQKTLGAAGVTVVIIPKHSVDKLDSTYIKFLDYKTHIEHKSNYHTPPVFAIYTMDLMLDWLMNEIGGLDEMERINKIKSDMLYDFLDNSTLFHCPIRKEDRSMMNVVFTITNEWLYEKILKEAEQNNIFGIKGHRSVPGNSFRVSLYNAVTIEDVQYLISFLSRY